MFTKRSNNLHWHTDRYGEGTGALLFGPACEKENMLGLDLLGFVVPSAGKPRKITAHRVQLSNATADKQNAR